MKETSRKKRFFQTALQLIHEKGFKAMTMRNLAEKLDCDVSNIYNYVQSKHALLAQLLFEISQKFHKGIASIEATNDSPRKKLEEIIALHVQLTVEHPYQVTLLVEEWRNLKSKKEKEQIKFEEFITFRNNYEQKLTTIIADGIEQGELRGENLVFTTNCVLSSIRWLYSWYSPTTTDLNQVELEQLMTNFIMNGVGVSKSVNQSDE